MSTGITILLVFIAVVVTLLIAVPVTRKIAVDNKIKQDAEKIGTAEEKARNIIDEALKTAETKKREALLEAKEESLRTKNEVEKETRERRAELQKYEKRVLSKEESVDKKADVLERRENEIAAKEASVRKKEKEVDGLHEKGVQELERISGFTSEEAKEYLLKSVEDEVKIDTAKLYKELESRAKEEAGRKAKEYVVTAIQKCAVDHVSESTISVVQLPSDEMKGRIIGREGRNIRTLETMTGVDLIIDDTPEAVVLSSFDPIRREVARIALEKLIVDGRIHPARIEDGRKGPQRSRTEYPRGRRGSRTGSRCTRTSSGADPSPWKNEIPFQLRTECIKAFDRGSTAFRSPRRRGRMRCPHGKTCRTAS